LTGQPAGITSVVSFTSQIGLQIIIKHWLKTTQLHYHHLHRQQQMLQQCQQLNGLPVSAQKCRELTNYPLYQFR